MIAARRLRFLLASVAALSMPGAAGAAGASAPPTVADVLEFERDHWARLVRADRVPAGTAPLEVRRLRCRSHGGFARELYFCRYRLSYGSVGAGEAAGRRWLGRGACALGEPAARGEDGRWDFDPAILEATPTGPCGSRTESVRPMSSSRY